MKHTGRRANVSLFLAATFLYWVSLYLYVPTLPAYVSLRTSNLAVVGVVLSMYGLWQAVIRVPFGLAVDASGRGKLFIAIGLCLSAAGALVMSLGTSVGVMALGRALTGLAAGTWVPLITVFSGFFAHEKAILATSLPTFSGSIGRMAATSANGFLNRIGGYPAAFIGAAAAAVLAAALIGSAPVGRQPRKKPSLKSFFMILLRKDVLVPTLMSTVVQFATWAVTFGFLPLLAQELGADDVVKGLLISANIGAFTVGNFLNTLLADRVDQRLKLLFTVVFFGGGIVIAASAPGVGALFGATVCMGAANGFNYPTLMGMCIRHVEQNQRTTAMGIHQAVYALGMFGGPWLGGILAEAFGIRIMFYATAGFCVSAASALLLFTERSAGPRRKLTP